MLKYRHHQVHFALNMATGLLLLGRLLDLYTLPAPAVWWVPKLLHLIGMVLFLGNIASIMVWSGWMLRSPHRELVLAGATSVLRADRWLTWPGQTLLVITGIWMLGPLPACELPPYLQWILRLFLLSLVLTVPMLRAQDQFLHAVDAKRHHVWVDHHLRWSAIYGMAALLPVLAVLVLMVGKGAGW